MKSICCVLFLALLSYTSGTHHHFEKEHHYALHHGIHAKELVPAYHKPILPTIPKIHLPVHHTPIEHRPILPPIPPPIFPIFPHKPVHKHHEKVKKLVPPPIVKPVPVPVPVAVPVPVPVPAKTHKQLVPFGTGHHKVEVHEHIDERFLH